MSSEGKNVANEYPILLGSHAEEVLPDEGVRAPPKIGGRENCEDWGTLLPSLTCVNRPAFYDRMGDVASYAFLDLMPRRRSQPEACVPPGVAAQAIRDRLAAGLSQMAVAAKLGRPQSFVSKCESGAPWVE